MRKYWRKVISIFLEGCSLLAFILSIIFTGALITPESTKGDWIVCVVGLCFAGVLMALARFVDDE